MSDEKIAGIMRDCVQAIVKGDVEKVLSLFAEDGVWTTPDGTFKGRDELRRYLTWFIRSVRDMTVKESGIRVMVQGNTGVYEHVLGGTMQGARYEGLAICVYEFKNEKIQEVRTVYDRLLLAKQVAKGWLAKWLVNMIVKQAEKGLR